MKKIVLSSIYLVAVILSSCTSVDEVNNQISSNNTCTSNVSVLTAKIQDMHSGLSYRNITEKGTRLPNTNFTRDDIIKIALADGTGALKRCYNFWWAVGNATVSSAIKASKIYTVKELRGYFQNQRHLRMPRNTDGGHIGDSIGYYHNVIEYKMYQQVPNLYTMSSLTLCMQVDSIIQILIPEHVRQPMSESEIISMADDIDIIRNIDQEEDMSFVEYVDALMEAYPDDSDYIDMIAQYLYDINYANEDIDEYTNEILWLIETSNLTEEEMLTLKNAVLVAYSSTLYNTNMVFTNN